MSKKVLNIQPVINELKGQSAFFRRDPEPPDTATESEDAAEPLEQGKLAQKENEEQKTNVTQKSTQESDVLRDTPSDTSREKPLREARSLPTREEIQEFSFRLRDELKVKVQAEVPHYWQKELEEVARELDVKKLELYRYIFGEFLGKIKRKINSE
jgi:hypothetical protein